MHQSPQVRDQARRMVREPGVGVVDDATLLVLADVQAVHCSFQGRAPVHYISVGFLWDAPQRDLPPPHAARTDPALSWSRPTAWDVCLVGKGSPHPGQPPPADRILAQSRSRGAGWTDLRPRQRTRRSRRQRGYEADPWIETPDTVPDNPVRGASRSGKASIFIPPVFRFL